MDEVKLVRLEGPIVLDIIDLKLQVWREPWVLLVAICYLQGALKRERESSAYMLG